MKIPQFSVGTSRTVNLGNFESLRIEASVTIDLSDEDNADMATARSNAQKFLRQLLEDSYRSQYEEQEKRRAAKK